MPTSDDRKVGVVVRKRPGLARMLAARNLRSDRFGTLCAIAGVALGTATVNVVLVLDVNTRAAESRVWTTNPDLAIETSQTVRLAGFRTNQTPVAARDPKEETHEDYQVMRSAIRLGSLSAFLIGALIVFFTFGIVVERRKKEIALLRSLGALRGQVAQIIVVEALSVGAAGAALGLAASVPMSIAAAMAGITTTGRSQIGWLWFPWKTMLLVSAIGGSVALLGIVRPARRVLGLDVARTLAPRFLSGDSGPTRARGVTLVALPFMALLYLLMRPFFVEVLPSLLFFALEAGAVCFAFLAALLLVPEVIRLAGAAAASIIPRGPSAAKLLVSKRIERMGGELAWSISGLMLVFALLLALHVVTRSLQLEVLAWAERAVRPYTFVYSRGAWSLPGGLIPTLPDSVQRAHFSSRTPWPNPVYAVNRQELIDLVKAGAGDQLAETAARLGPGKAVLSRMMARRFGLSEGDFLVIDGKTKLEVVAITDDVGYVPMIGPYRNSKTYALIDMRDFPLIARWSAPNAAVALADSSGRDAEWLTLLDPLRNRRGLRVDAGTDFERDRVFETNRDFAIFDFILFFSTLLAAIGIANNMVLSVHARSREIALYRVLGMTPQQIRRMFVLEGAFVGLLGGPLAVALGIPLGAAAIAALETISAFEVHFDLPISYVVLTIAGALAVAVLSSLYPASRAAVSSSAESVHYE